MDRFFPRTFGAEPNLRRQKLALMSATGVAPLSSSPGIKSRPSAGLTPYTEKKSAETNRPTTRSASPAPIRLKPNPREMAIAENVRLSFCQRSEEHTSDLQSLTNLVCRLLLG